jgi:segregation and condensation protein B
VSKNGALVEAMLFLETSPVSVELIIENCKLQAQDVTDAINELTQKYAGEDSGIVLNQNSVGEYQLLPKNEHWEALKEKYGRRNEGKLSRAALETLTIIAYMQPVTRAEIEQIRGVSADNMIRLLQEKALVREVGKKDTPGKPVQFGTTTEFLSVFHLETIADLPKLGEGDADRFELERE